MNSTSATLIQRVCQSMDENAWARFVELYTPLLYFWARRTGCEPNDAADLVQEVFGRLVEKLPSFDYDSGKSFRAWLRTVAHNCWRNAQRRARLPMDRQAELSEITAPTDEQFWESEYRHKLVRKALALIQSEFSATTWQAFWETVFHGKSPRDVAQSLKISEGAVYTARSRVLSRLRQEFSGFFE